MDPGYNLQVGFVEGQAAEESEEEGGDEHDVLFEVGKLAKGHLVGDVEDKVVDEVDGRPDELGPKDLGTG
jgi:hypothetical protein